MKERLLALARIGLGGLFVYSASTKIPDLARLTEEVANYRMLPPGLVSFFAVALTGTELLAGAALILGLAVRAAAGLVAAMLVAFVIALSQALLRGIDLRCGCFGGAEPATWATVARDVAMLAAAILVAVASPRPTRR